MKFGLERTVASGRTMVVSLAMLAMLTVVGCGTDDGGQTGTQADATAVDATADAGAKTTEVTGCAGSKLLALQEAPGLDDADLMHGPWAVGARTLTIDGLTVEVWYPAAAGSADGVVAKRYDLRQWLPKAEQSKIPDAEAPALDCDCHPDLPPDTAHGPYPAVVFIHGTAGFRAQSMAICTAWASHGFVVVAADHPKIVLQDALALNLGADQPGDARRLLDALRKKDAALGPLAAILDPQRFGVSGHSAGGMATGSLGAEAGVQVAIPMAARGVDPAGPATATVVLGGIDDGTVKWSATVEGYEKTVGSKWLVGLQGAGHLAFSDLCRFGADKGGLFGIAKTYGITMPPGTEPLFEKLASDGCGAGQMAPARSARLSVAASLPVLRQVLHCQQGAAAAFEVVEKASDVGEARKAP